MQFELATSREIAQELGHRLRAHRLSQNLQQDELAQRAGVSQRTVSNLERTGQASLDSFLCIITALGLASSLSSLFDYKPTSIKAMEKASTARKRASRRPA